MNNIFVLNIVKEVEGQCAESTVRLYRYIDDAFDAYNAAVDVARNDAEERFGEAREDPEIRTEYFRFFRIYDNNGFDTTTITVETEEVIESDRGESDGL